MVCLENEHFLSISMDDHNPELDFHNFLFLKNERLASIIKKWKSKNKENLDIYSVQKDEEGGS